MEREREKKKRKMKAKGVCSFFFKKSVVTLSPTTKIFVLENELTKKEIKV